MTEHDRHDEDREWKALLHAATPEPPFDEVDWATLHASVTARAEPLLNRTRTSWWQHVAGWSMRGIPAALAAAALVLFMVSDVVRPSAANGSADFDTIEEALATALPDDGTSLFLASEDVADALLFYGVE